MGAKASLPYDGPPANLGWDIPPGALGLSLGAGRGNTNTHRSCSALLWGNKRDLWVSFLKSLQPLLLLEVIGGSCRHGNVGRPPAGPSLPAPLTSLRMITFWQIK